MKTYVIGDIHGAYKALCQVLDKAPIKPGDTIIQLGDVADGWNEVKDCVDYLLQLKEEYNMIFIKGNHDDWTMDWMNSGLPADFHRTQGGQATFDSYIGGIPQEHISFFRNQEPYYKDKEGNIFVHGGFNRHYTLEDHISGMETYSDIFWWDRDLWMQALSYKEMKSILGEEAHPLKIKEPCKEVFIGHTTTMNWKTDKPMHAANIWNLDTGAGFRGRLTIMDIDSKEYWQSDLVQELYPEQKGRNK
jgi:serine/threonine protein phosphatase 1